ncbi:MAG: hypothetical protein ACW964_12290 [Candidatus Hodarchaeales archaeon]
MKKNNINNYNLTNVIGSVFSSLFNSNNTKTMHPKRRAYVPINLRRI